MRRAGWRRSGEIAIETRESSGKREREGKGKGRVAIAGGLSFFQYFPWRTIFFSIRSIAADEYLRPSSSPGGDTMRLQRRFNNARSTRR